MVAQNSAPITSLPSVIADEHDTMRSHSTAQEENSRQKQVSNSMGSFSSGSIASSGFTLAKATLGAGCLSLPSAFYATGIPLSLVFLVLMGVLTILSVRMIARSLEYSKTSSLEGLCLFFFGPLPTIFFELSLIIFCLGTAVVYLITISQTLEPVFQKALGTENEHEFGIWSYILLNRGALSTLVLTLFLLPLSLVERINDVRYVSLLGVFCIFFLIFTVFWLFTRDGLSASLSRSGQTVWSPSSGVGPIISAASSYIFAFCGQPNVPQVYCELHNKSERSMLKVVILAVVMAGVSYLVIGLFGYLRFGSDVKSSVISNMQTDLLAGDTLVTLAFIFMSVAVLGAYPLNIYPAKSCFISIVKRLSWGPIRESSLVWRGGKVCLVVCLCYLTLLIAIYLPSVSEILSFIGASTGSILCYVLPAGAALKVAYYQKFLLRSKGSPNESSHDMEQPGTVESLDGTEDTKEATERTNSPRRWLSVVRENPLEGVILISGSVFTVVGSYQATLDIVHYYD